MLIQLKLWLKSEQTPMACALNRLARSVLQFELPTFKPFVRLLLSLHLLITGICSSAARIFYWTPLFKGRIQAGGKHLYLYGGMPYVSGPLAIRIGKGARISGQTTFSGRAVSRSDGIEPCLCIGSNVDIGWQTTIAVGTKVIIGDNARLAGRHFLAGYPGHPLNARDRALGLPELDCQCGDIVIEDDVWLATGVSVMAGVRIGQGTIVAAGSVVTHDLPSFVLAAGVPAKIIKSLPRAWH
jgi:acetyltransferase-like isoleucine patch superfamily enzyme